jgi:hypothetical protein
MRMKPRANPSVRILTPLAFALSLGACAQEASNTQPSDTTGDAAGLAQGTLLSAFFGLDNSLPFVAHRICLGGGGQDGMPVITSSEVDHTTLQAGDFRVVKASGEEGSVHCASLLPATDAGELRTILLIGEFGNEGDDPPASVEIKGNLLSLDGATNFKGASVAVTPLKDGPFLVAAELVSDKERDMGLSAAGTRGSLCTSENTVQQLRVVWAGGVTLKGGDAPTQETGKLYQITVRSEEGTMREVAPIELADHEDPDNNHVLCLDTADEPISVTFPKGLFTDPNEDLNPATTITVTAKE